MDIPSIGRSMNDETAALAKRVADREREIEVVHRYWTGRVSKLKTENARLREAGQALHDAVDSRNNTSTANTGARHVFLCGLCFAHDYDGTGIVHKEDCPLVHWRAALGKEVE